MSASVVPARAGMSPAEVRGAWNLGRGPRASGDEPRGQTIPSLLPQWSPRERG